MKLGFGKVQLLEEVIQGMHRPSLVAAVVGVVFTPEHTVSSVVNPLWLISCSLTNLGCASTMCTLYFVHRLFIAKV